VLWRRSWLRLEISVHFGRVSAPAWIMTGRRPATTSQTGAPRRAGLQHTARGRYRDRALYAPRDRSRCRSTRSKRGLLCACGQRQRRRDSSQAGTDRGGGWGTPGRPPHGRPVHRTTIRPAEACAAARWVLWVAWRSTQEGERSAKTGSMPAAWPGRCRRRRLPCAQPGDVGGGARPLLAFARAHLAFVLSQLDRRVAPVSLTPAMKATWASG
jgi:hypothetical protein